MESRCIRTKGGDPEKAQRAQMRELGPKDEQGLMGAQAEARLGLLAPPAHQEPGGGRGSC